MSIFPIDDPRLPAKGVTDKLFWPEPGKLREELKAQRRLEAERLAALREFESAVSAFYRDNNLDGMFTESVDGALEMARIAIAKAQTRWPAGETGAHA